MIKSQLYFKNRLQTSDIDFSSSLLIYDQVLRHHHVGAKIIKKFVNNYEVKAGESLKNIRYFPAHVEKMVEIIKDRNQRDLTIVGMGGGSVGDFAGFFASVLKRGVGLVHLPSTWLAALDSAHGGKTALNTLGLKNQIGSFYPAQKIFLLKDLLFSQGQERIEDAAGELFKAALIDGGSLWKSFNQLDEINNEDFWQLLPKAVKAKYKVVNNDPYEKSGFRQVLNLGHSLGHVIEAQLGQSHGTSVGQGLVFATRWSYTAGYLSQKNFNLISQNHFYLNFEEALGKSLKKLRRHDVERHLAMDKKKNSAKDLNFIFLLRPGICTRQKVSIKSMLREFESQKRHA